MLALRTSKLHTSRMCYFAISLLAIFCLSMVTFPSLLPSSTHAEPGVEATTTLSISPSSTLSLIAEPGSFVSGTETINVSTNNYTGYTLTMTTNGSSTDLVSSSSEVTIPTITLPEGVDSITSTDFTTASYGYSLNSTDFMPVPDTASEGVVIATTNAEDPKTNTHDLTFGAKTDTTTPAGTYEQTFTISAVANATGYTITYDANVPSEELEGIINMPTPNPKQGTISGTDVYLDNTVPERPGYAFLGWAEADDATTADYEAGDSFPLDPETDNTLTLYAIWECGDGYICYDDNGADENNGGKGTMQPNTLQSSAYAANASATLVAPNYSKSGYGFVGWSETRIDPEAENVKSLISAQAQANPRTIYGPNETITMPSPIAPKQLYAVWLKAETETVNNVTTPVYLQGWSGCSSMNDGDIITLTDNRDNNVYAVVKIEKNKGESDEYSRCWFIENLRLDVGAATITDANTDHPTDGFKQKLTYPSSASLLSCRFSGDELCINQVSYGLGNVTGDVTSSSYNNGDQSTRWYSYGGMYNWYTATAGVAFGESADASLSSICPFGWKLPSGHLTVSTGYNSYADLGDFGRLRVALGENDVSLMRTYPTNFVRSGEYASIEYDKGKAFNRGMAILYWSSTSRTMSDAVIENERSDIFNLYEPRSSGMAIRCVAAPLQTFTLSYDTNGGENAPASESVTNTTGVFEHITTSTPTRSGYTFAGWTDEQGNEAQAGGQYMAVDLSTTLYALWANDACYHPDSNDPNASPFATTIGTGNSTDAKCLQDMNHTVKATMPVATSTTGTYTLIDARDNKSYTVAKLKDDEVWMTKNLNFGNNSETIISSHDSDLPSGSVFKVPASTTSFETANNSTTYVSPKVLIDNTYGGYYSYAAAIASTTDYSANQDITTSICPSGWDLPTSTQYNNLKSKASLINYSTAHAAPYNFIYAGYRNGTSFTSQTSAIRLWTSTNYNSNYAYYTTAHGTASYSSNYKRYGESIRCVASNGTATIHYDANGGSGAMDDQIVELSYSTISSNSFTAPAKKIFQKWCTNADGSGTCVYPSNKASLVASAGDNIILYAIWENLLTLNYNANGGSGTTAAQTVKANASVTIRPAFTFTAPAKKIFQKWCTNADGTGTCYNASTSFTAPSTVNYGDEITLYAIWENAFTINYNANGGSGTTAAQTLKAGDSATVKSASTFTAPAKKIFQKWCTNADGTGTCYNASTSFTAPSTVNYGDEITLYAQWDNAYVLTFVNTALSSNNTTTKNVLVGQSTPVSPTTSWTRDGYAIAGWDTATNNGSDTVGTIAYRDNQVITPSADMTLYTVWRSNTILDYGSTVNAKLKMIANNSSSFDNGSIDTMIKAIRRATELPTGFTATYNNTISSYASSAHPVYIFFDNTNNDGIMYYYTDAGIISAHPSSACMFMHMSSLSDISGLSDWNTSNVTNMVDMFLGDSSLSDLSGIANWDTHSVTNMAEMFMHTAIEDVNALRTGGPNGDQPNVWNTSAVTIMGNLFYDASSLSDLSAIANWDVSKVTATASTNYFYQMFYNVPSRANFVFTNRPGSVNNDGTYVPNE